MENLHFSLVIPTRDRLDDLVELFYTILDQSWTPYEVIVVDDSPVESAKQVVNKFCSRFKSIRCELKYINGKGQGLSAARNAGIRVSTGDVILFLDDDTLLGQTVIETLTKFLKDNSNAIGVQPKIIASSANSKENVFRKFKEAFYKVLMLTFREKDRFAVRRSGQSVFPSEITKVIPAQRLSGCSCWRREIFTQQLYDTNLKRWAFMEDLDFSYRAYKKNPRSLFVTPNATIIHKTSMEARLENETVVYMVTIYWFYIFFKDFFQASILNLMAFLWALTGNLFVTVSELIIKRRNKWQHLIYLLRSYAIACKNLKNIRMGKLDFFNNSL